MDRSAAEHDLTDHPPSDIEMGTKDCQLIDLEKDLCSEQSLREPTHDEHRSEPHGSTGKKKLFRPFPAQVNDARRSQTSSERRGNDQSQDLTQSIDLSNPEAMEQYPQHHGPVRYNQGSRSSPIQDKSVIQGLRHHRDYLEQHRDHTDDVNQTLRNRINVQKEQIKRLRDDVEQLEYEQNEFKKQNDERRYQDLMKSDKAIARQQQIIVELQEAHMADSAEIKGKMEKIVDLESELIDREAQLEQQAKQIESLQSEIDNIRKNAEDENDMSPASIEKDTETRLRQQISELEQRHLDDAQIVARQHRRILVLERTNDLADTPHPELRDRVATLENKLNITRTFFVERQRRFELARVHFREFLTRWEEFLADEV